jgi:NADPH:quinone reductase-like Zn-dependent oxidoreductase
VGTEGAGIVIATGPSPTAQALLGRRVGIAGGAMYAQYRVVDASACLVLPEGATARDGASSFVNPMTALGMVETMRRDGHSGLVHTAAASNLGQMLVKLCQEDGIPLVNIVRKPEQEELLRSLGAIHVCNSGSLSFATELVEAHVSSGPDSPQRCCVGHWISLPTSLSTWSMVTPILMSIGSVRFAGDAHIHEQTTPQFASEATRSGSDQPM